MLCFKFLPQPFQTLDVAFRITVFKEAGVAIMGCADAAGMLYRAPVLLGTGGDLSGERRQSVAVGTVKTVEFFYNVEVRQVFPIEHQIFRALDLGNPVEGKADCLIAAKKNIQHDERNETGIDDRSGQDICQPGFEKILHQSRLEPALLAGDLFGKADPLLLDDKIKRLPLLPVLGLQLLFQFVYLAQQIINVMTQGTSSVTNIGLSTKFPEPNKTYLRILLYVFKMYRSCKINKLYFN